MTCSTVLNSKLPKQNETAILINDASGAFAWTLDRAWPPLRPAFCVIELPAKFILMFPGDQRLTLCATRTRPLVRRTTAMR